MKKIKLPEVSLSGNIPIEKALFKRRSHRSFRKSPLTAKEISQLLWAGQGVTGEEGLRTSPSAGALYPIELYLAAGNINDIPQGVYRYDPFTHSIISVLEKDVRNLLYEACLYQEYVLNAPANIVITAEFERTTVKYGDRGVRYVYMEAGHVAQNIYLQTVSLGLGTVSIGAFYDSLVKRILSISYEPIYIMPIGKIILF